MNKILPITILSLAIIFATFYLLGRAENSKEDLIQCLADKGVVIYGTQTCPACNYLVDLFGGHEKISPIYVDCNQERERCSQEMQTEFVPEIQIKEELYRGPRTLKALAEETGCQPNN